MAITVDWSNKIINVPKADLLLINPTNQLYQLDLDSFRLELKALEASAEGMPFEDTHAHNPPVTVGGVTLARVVEIINGYTVTFEDGAYRVQLSGANNNLLDVANLNQVSIGSTNSAGLTFSDQINAQSFTGDAVSIDTISGLSGIVFPRGTPTDPVDNFPDALTIANARGLHRFKLIGNTTLAGGPFPHHTFISNGAHEAENLNLGGQDVDGSSFIDLQVTGTQAGARPIYSGCALLAISDLSGIALNSGIGAGNVFQDGQVFAAHSCHGMGMNATISYANSTTGISAYFTHWGGYIEIHDMTNANDLAELNVTSGKIVIDSSCTNGNIRIRGNAEIEDNSAGTTVETPSPASITSKINGVAQAGGASTMTFPANAAPIDDYYLPGVILITGGTGEGQSRKITAYNGTTKVATVDTAWDTVPDSTSEFSVLVSGLTEAEATKLQSLLTLVNYLENKN